MVTMDFIMSVVENYLMYNANRVMFNWAANGGWERWFQGELSWMFSKSIPVVENEVKPDTLIDVETSQRVDISLIDYYNSIAYIELKCFSFIQITNENIEHFYQSVINDWKKLWYMKHKKYSLVMIPNDVNGVGKRLQERLKNIAVSNHIHILIKLCNSNYCNKYMYVCLFEISNQNINILNP